MKGNLPIILIWTMCCVYGQESGNVACGHPNKVKEMFELCVTQILEKILKYIYMNKKTI